MSTRTTSPLSAALGQVRYRLALNVVGFGVFIGWVLACTIPLFIYGSYFDHGGPISEAFRWVVAGYMTVVPVALTYRCRSWIVRKANEDCPPEPVTLWTGADIAEAGLEVVRLVLSLIALFVGLVVFAALIYCGYLLLTVVSVPVAILIGAIIIAVAILIAASAQ